MKKVIWVDLDEVLSETVDKVLEIHDWVINNKKVARDDISNYYLHENKWLWIKKEDWIKVFDKLRNSKQSNNIIPVKWAIEKLKQLKSEWYKFIIITARREILKAYTNKWIQKNFPWIFENIIFTNHYTENEIQKSEVCKKNWIQIMIEDNLEFWSELAANWIKVYLLDKPRNKHYNPETHKWIIKVNGWNEIKF